MSVHMTNAASGIILAVLIDSSAVAAGASMLASPIGALGGAVFGAVHCISQIPLISLGSRCLNAAHPQASSAARTVAAALKFFGSYAAAWGVLAAAGFSLGLSDVLLLTGASLCCVIPIEWFLHLISPRPAVAY